MANPQIKPHILLIADGGNDGAGMVPALTELLEQAAYVVETAGLGGTGLASATSKRFAAILVDSTLLRTSGLEFCRELRMRGVDTALLLFTARGHVSDRVEGLRSGADDCLTKPFDSAELLARLEALLRRTMRTSGTSHSTFQFGDVEVDFFHSEVTRDGQPVKLASKELELLRYLISHRERVVPREELMRQVWDYASDTSSRTVDTHVVWLRHKLEVNPQAPQFIKTVRGRGYRFTDQSISG